MKAYRNSIFAILVSVSSVISLNAQDIEITSIITTPVTCGTGSDGTITVTITGGTGPYSYLLSKGAIPVEEAGPIASQTFTFTGHDKYTNYWVIVSDESPAAGDFEFATITGPNPISITSATAADFSCNNADNGTINVSATGEGGNFIFSLAGPINETNETGLFAGLLEGDYTVTVSDKDGCPSTDVTPVLTINNPSVISISVDIVSDVLCFGDNSGSITITPSGGTPSGMGTGYTYQWTGPNGFTSTAEDIVNLEAGNYSVTVYDGNMCIGSAGPITIDQPADLTVILNGNTNVTCNAGNDGTAQITAGGGAGGYSYSWDGQSNGLVSSDEDPVNLVADIYDLTLWDANGCSKTFISFVTIDEPLPFNIVLNGTTDVSCAGGNDGTANITPDGGTPPYVFAWTGAGSGYVSSDEDPGNMPADTYSLTITDSRGCSMFYSALLTITEPSPLTLVLNGSSDVSCFGGSDGTANITVAGGTPPLLFEWRGDGSGHSSILEDPNDLIADTYDLIITDNNGCVQLYNNLVTIGEPAELTVILDNITDVACNGEATGTIEITPFGGTPIYTFAWTGPNGFTANTQNLTNLETGDYNLTISDVNGCSRNYMGLATVGESTAITALFSLTNISCSGGSDGAINVSVSGGTPNYTYNWSGPFGFTSSNEDISGLIPGVYILRITDDLGCLQVMSPQFLTAPQPLIVSSTHVDIDCFGASNGSVDLTVSGGTGPYLFAWTGPGGFTSSLEDISGLEPGAYSVVITDANLCITPNPDIATILEPAEILVSSVKTDISCGGLADGAIDIIVTGGTLPYLFAWTGPSGFTSALEDISGLEAGSYSLTITDGNGCVVGFPNQETIIEPPPIVADYISHQDVFCNGDATGSIEIDVTGGTPPLAFDWTNSSGVTQSTDEDPVGLQAETYSLRIIDINGCFVTYPNLVIISQPPVLVVSLAKTDIACFADANGTITITSSGGTGAYEYSRLGDSGPAYQPGNVFTALGPGFYTIWTRDANLCVVSDTITIKEPLEIQIASETIIGENLCYGDSSAQISINGVTGGVSPYEYSINNGTDFYPSNLFSNLPAGTYQTLVRDASGCSATGNLNAITEPSSIQITSYIQDDITSCFNASEGRIRIVATGGTGIISYILNGTVPSASGDFQNLPGGPHQIDISDENGCTTDTSVVIIAPLEIIVDNLTITNVTGCSGDANGSVTAAGSGGTGAITYSMDGGSYQPSGTFNGLLAGNHIITLKDNNNCTRDTAIYISEPAPISILSEVTPITCSGAGDGAIQIITAGGTAPLTYTLNPGAVSNGSGLFNGLNANTYTVTVNDAPGCGPVSSSPLIITEPPILVINSITDVNISCNGADNGSIDISVSGGVPPYQFTVDNQASWSDDSIFIGLTPGTYEVYIRDANLCVIYGGSFTMTDPPLLSLDVSNIDITSCSGDTTGVLDASGTGGTGNLEYSLDGMVFQSSGIFNNLPAGSYTVYLRDESGCSVTTPADIIEPDSVTALITKTDATYGNLGSITISATSGGTPPYEYSISGDTGTFTTETVYTDLEAATYHVIVRDQNGCIYQKMVNISDVPPLDVMVNISNVSCFGATDGSIEFVPQDAEGTVEYSIDSGANFVTVALFENLPGNTTYYLVARDEAGKAFTSTEFIPEPAELILSRNISPAECNAFSETGAIDVDISGGSGTYSFLWSDGSTDKDRVNIEAGVYILETIDSENCSRTDTMLVTSKGGFVMAYAGEDTIICYGESIQLDGLGGHIPSWAPSEFLTDTSVANPVTLGITNPTTFVLTITEEVSGYGCFNMDSITVDLYPQMGIDATEDTFVISGSSVQLEVTGGPFNEYRWEPFTGLNNSAIPDPIATPVEPIRYYVYGTNEFGCEESDSLFIDVFEDIEVYNVFSPNGDGVNEYFEIEHAERFPDMHVEIYNRWGSLLYSTENYDSGSQWDGTSRGKEAPVGTYYYVIIPYSGARPITGNVTIIR